MPPSLRPFFDVERHEFRPVSEKDPRKVIRYLGDRPLFSEPDRNTDRGWDYTYARAQSNYAEQWCADNYYEPKILDHMQRQVELARIRMTTRVEPAPEPYRRDEPGIQFDPQQFKFVWIDPGCDARIVTVGDFGHAEDRGWNRHDAMAQVAYARKDGTPRIVEYMELQLQYATGRHEEHKTEQDARHTEARIRTKVQLAIDKSSRRQARSDSDLRQQIRALQEQSERAAIDAHQAMLAVNHAQHQAEVAQHQAEVAQHQAEVAQHQVKAAKQEAEAAKAARTHRRMFHFDDED